MSSARFLSQSGRRTRMVEVSGFEIVLLKIPRRSVRGPIYINTDTVHIDRRCLARYRRRRRLLDRYVREITFKVFR